MFFLKDFEHRYIYYKTNADPSLVQVESDEKTRVEAALEEDLKDDSVILAINRAFAAGSPTEIDILDALNKTKAALELDLDDYEGERKKYEMRRMYRRIFAIVDEKINRNSTALDQPLDTIRSAAEAGVNNLRAKAREIAAKFAEMNINYKDDINNYFDTQSFIDALTAIDQDSIMSALFKGDDLTFGSKTVDFSGDLDAKTIKEKFKEGFDALEIEIFQKPIASIDPAGASGLKLEVLMSGASKDARANQAIEVRKIYGQLAALIADTKSSFDDLATQYARVKTKSEDPRRIKEKFDLLARVKKDVPNPSEENRKATMSYDSSTNDLICVDANGNQITDDYIVTDLLSWSLANRNQRNGLDKKNEEELKKYARFAYTEFRSRLIDDRNLNGTLANEISLMTDFEALSNVEKAERIRQIIGRILNDDSGASKFLIGTDNAVKERELLLLGFHFGIEMKADTDIVDVLQEKIYLDYVKATPQLNPTTIQTSIGERVNAFGGQIGNPVRSMMAVRTEKTTVNDLTSHLRLDVTRRISAEFSNEDLSEGSEARDKMIKKTAQEMLQARLNLMAKMSQGGGGILDSKFMKRFENTKHFEKGAFAVAACLILGSGGFLLPYGALMQGLTIIAGVEGVGRLVKGIHRLTDGAYTTSKIGELNNDELNHALAKKIITANTVGAKFAKTEKEPMSSLISGGPAEYRKSLASADKLWNSTRTRLEREIAKVFDESYKDNKDNNDKAISEALRKIYSVDGFEGNFYSELENQSKVRGRGRLVHNILRTGVGLNFGAPVLWSTLSFLAKPLGFVFGASKAAIAASPAAGMLGGGAVVGGVGYGMHRYNARNNSEDE